MTKKTSWHGNILNTAKKTLSSWPNKRKLNLKLSIFKLKQTFRVGQKHNNTRFQVAEHSFQEPIPNSPLLLSYLSFGAHFCKSQD